MQTITFETEHMSLVARLRLWWDERKEREQALRELSMLDAESLRELAVDNGLTPIELVRAATAGSHGADEMAMMMQALNIDPVEVWLADPTDYRSMELACASCRDKKACRKDLRKGSAPKHYLDYCRNAETLNALRAEPEMLAS